MVSTVTGTGFFRVVSGCSGSLLQSKDTQPRLIGCYKMPAGMNGCLSLDVSPAMKRGFVQGEPHLLPGVSWDRLQCLGALEKIFFNDGVGVLERHLLKAKPEKEELKRDYWRKKCRSYHCKTFPFTPITLGNNC